MPQVLSDAHRHIALEVTRGEQNVAFVSLNGAGIELRRAAKRDFDDEFYLEPPIGTNGIAPTPRHYARIMLKTGGTNWPITADAARALLQELSLAVDDPRSDKVVLLATRSGNLIGSFESREDAETAARYYESPLLVDSPLALTEWPASQIETLRKQVAPSLKAKDPKKLRQGVFAMAIAAPKVDAPAPKKIEKTTKERPARADGPVAKVKAYVVANADKFKSGTLTKKDAVAALIAAGVVKGTIGVQLPKQLKALGITAQKGTAPKKEKAAKANGAAGAPAVKKAGGKPAAKKSGKPAAKKPAAKKSKK